ncbi:hypothetical protein HF1_11530 [Mycoplasma haemofelis str. Langford 1]|uniref:Uncharacterized protein n=1 Tax=Mycoplasma haemofelis (strain Langford 1) TaxID=941640 RepID=E8ZJ40_MYCHL|nr:hypothetical protein [Mycoplasma haemofelis]CBY93161.1 hypothetical protein HF1_11530 [Mycoplasma haemofelis str. Langford 1]
MTTAFKTSLLAAGATATAGVGAFAAKGLLPHKELISSLISKDPSKRVIGSEEQEYWKKAWEKYKGSGKDVWKLGTLNGESPSEFKNECKNKLNSEVSDQNSSEYKDFLLYCSRDTLVSDLIRENNPNKELITSTEVTAQEWVDNWKRYLADSRTDKQGKDSILGLSDWSSVHSTDTKAPATLISKCSESFKTPFYDVRGALYLNVLEFCTKARSTK